MSRQDNRSDAALRERLELAEKAVPKGEKTIWTADFASPHETCVRDAFTERSLTMEDYTDQATAAHIAANHPDVVRADIEEILRLRQEVARLEDMLAHLASRSVCQTVEGWWSAHGETFQTKKDAMQHVITKAEDEMKEAARKAVEEEERHG